MQFIISITEQHEQMLVVQHQVRPLVEARQLGGMVRLLGPRPQTEVRRLLAQAQLLAPL